MRFTLKGYQTDAVADVLKHLDDARDDVRRKDRKVAFALSATTGAGKTVMATAVIEALFHGSEDFAVDPDPSAVVLWVTDDPSLNEQTRYRIIECGDRLDVSRLRVIDDGFNQDRFEPGNVFFLNVQKLVATSNLVKRTDKRTYTLWDTIRNTIEAGDLTLYLVLDEAHKGMRSASSRAADPDKTRSTIVQRLINGHDGIPPAPIVWGISATVQRFTDAMTAAQAQGRTTYPPVAVDARAVQESGLLKDTIILEFPDEAGAFETTLLRSALRQMREASALWADYADREGLPNPVLPLMVLQVPNSPKATDLARFVDIVREAWPELGPDAVANVFGEHADLSLGARSVPYIAPQDVQDATHVRVLLAKDAVSTGWDCPRAEVLFSLRPAQDRTHITQLLGRMVRTPLARRVESDERLNAVTCVLPFFDQPTASDVAMVLTGEKADADDPGGGSPKGLGRKILTSPVTMLWNPSNPTGIAELLAALPSETTPKGNPKPIKRLLSLAAEIAVDGLMDKPNSRAHQAWLAVLDGQAAQHRGAVEAAVEDIYTAEIRRITSSMTRSVMEESTRQERADDRTVDDAYRSASRALGAAVANAYARQIALVEAAEDDDIDFPAAKAKVAALMSVPGVLDAVETEADKTTEKWLNQLRTKTKGLSDERRTVFDDIKREAREPQLIDITTPVSRIENTKNAEGDLVSTRPKHLLVDRDGNVPIGDLND